MDISSHSEFPESVAARVDSAPKTPKNRSVKTSFRNNENSSTDTSPNYLHLAIESSYKRQRKRLRSQLKRLDNLLLAPIDMSWMTQPDDMTQSPVSDTSEVTFWSDANEIYDKIEHYEVENMVWTSPTRSLLI